MWNIFFFKIPQFNICCFIFLLFLKFSFQFRLSVLFNKFWKFLCFLILCIRDFIKDFWKIMEHLSKKYWHLKSKIIHKFHYLLFIFFILLAFLTSFFPISPNQSCQKIWNIFVVHYYTDYRFYQSILENSWILIKKNRDIVNTKYFQNSIVYYLLFNFLVFLTSFFLFYLSMVFKKFLKILYCHIVWIRDFTKIFCKTMVFFLKKLRYLKSRISTKFHHYYFFFIF